MKKILTWLMDVALHVLIVSSGGDSSKNLVMALSNWDTLAIGEDGSPSIGRATLGNFGVEIYKNWCYISHKALWEAADPSTESTYTKYVIGQMFEGDLQILGLTLKAKRGLQNAIYLYAEQRGEYEWFTEQGEKKMREVKPPQHFAGIGCSGFASLEAEYLEKKLGKLPAPADELLIFSTNRGDDNKEHVGFHWEGKEILVPVDDGIDLNPYIGVAEETFKDFKAWMQDKNTSVDERFLERIQWDALTRFNQGDAYLSQRTGVEVPLRKPGEDTEEPIFLSAIKAMKPPDNQTT